MTPPDICPKCRSELPSAAAPCPQCGSQPPSEPGSPEPGAPKEAAGITGLIEMDYSVAGEDDKPELPQWRIDLSRRFQEIKSRREIAVPGESSGVADIDAGAGAERTDAGDAKETAEQATPVAALPKPRRPRTARPPGRPEITGAPAQPAPMPLFEPPPAPPAAAPAPSSTIQEMIDRAVAQKAPAPAPPPVVADPVLRAPDAIPARPEPPTLESRLILLSRTLSGLVDLIVVVCCSGAFVIAADSASGIHTLDGRSVVHYLALLLAMFFLYSIFFLFTGNQTIGMMITDLCVVDVDGIRPRMAHIVRRCVLFLVSLLTAGIGLLWGCFDEQARCLHDRYSGTRIVRLAR